MKIQGSLVIDVSKWNHHINTQELINGGVVSVIVGLYKQWSLLKFKYVLNDNCRRIADQVAASSLIMQTYFYYYPQNDPIRDADWFVDAMAGYPVKYAWADQEDHGKDMSALLRSEQHRRFAEHLHARFPSSGVYTARWYVDGYAPEMNKWLPKYLAWIAEYGKQPTFRTEMTWTQFKANYLPNYDILLAAGQPAAQVVGHQFTGDRCILPGTYDQNNRWMALDVSVFTPAFIDTLRSGSAYVPPVPLPQNIYKVNINLMNVRSSPDSTSVVNVIGQISMGTQVIVDTISGSWSHFKGQVGFPAGGWVWSAYLTKSGG